MVIIKYSHDFIIILIFFYNYYIYIPIFYILYINIKVKLYDEIRIHITMRMHKIICMRFRYYLKLLFLIRFIADYYLVIIYKSLTMQD